MLAILMVLSIHSFAFDSLPADCKKGCSGSSNCQVCMSACESYIGRYADIISVRNSILAREPVNTSGYDGQAVYNLESCWCSACCDYKYGGDSVHPCIYPCPCTIKNTTNNATTTTIYDKNRRPELNTSVNEIKDSVNYNVCYLLNLLWIVIPGISALIIMWAGSRYMASEEDPAKRQAARNTLVYALTGLVLSLVACPAVDYLIVNTDITPLESSCKCYEMMSLKPGVPPTLPYITNITTQPFIQTTHGVPTTVVRNGTTSTSSTKGATTTTTLGSMVTCEEYKKTNKLPSTFSWRNVNGKNYMTAVRDQDCGDCWAHAEIATVEGQYKVEQDIPSYQFDLSEQYLVSTCFPPAGCGGLTFGDEGKLHTFMKSTGATNEACYPYKHGVDSQCSERCSDWANKLWHIKSFSKSSSARDAIKQNIICKGPMWVASVSWGHAICLVGWDTQGWVIKNSWGTGWGNGGYGTVAYSNSYADMINVAYNLMGVTAPA